MADGQEERTGRQSEVFIAIKYLGVFLRLTTPNITKPSTISGLS